MEFVDSDPIARLALAFMPGVTCATMHRMEEFGISVDEFFRLDTLELSSRLGASRRAMFTTADRDRALACARSEMEFITRHNIRMLVIGDGDYPERLAECHDAPPVIFSLGAGDLSPAHPVALVGTRKSTPYGNTFCDTLVSDTAALLGGDLCVISGLAYGIDAAAHKAALNSKVPTIAIVAHGLDTIYPASHRQLASRIVAEGGAIITRYPSGTKPFRPRFLERNRIVAGLSDVVGVIESPVKGGAMSTAAAAFDYDREVMALPGRISDECSKGCNRLLRTNRASVLTCAADLIDTAGWSADAEIAIPQPILPIFEEENNPDRSAVLNALHNASGNLSADDLHILTSLPVPKLLALLSEMEFDGQILRFPGNRFAIAR